VSVQEVTGQLTPATAGSVRISIVDEVLRNLLPVTVTATPPLVTTLSGEASEKDGAVQSGHRTQGHHRSMSESIET